MKVVQFSQGPLTQTLCRSRCGVELNDGEIGGLSVAVPQLLESYGELNPDEATLRDPPRLQSHMQCVWKESQDQERTGDSHQKISWKWSWHQQHAILNPVSRAQ